MTTQICFIYRCSAKADMYLYLSQRDDFSCLPVELAKRVGQLDFTMEVELSKQKKLAQENPATVIENLRKQGFHLQLPAATPIDEILTRIADEQNVAAKNNFNGK